MAVCAGSGGSVFKGMNLSGVDLVVTGEMSHHDVLELNQKNVSVLLTEHSNSERGFLTVLKKMLEDRRIDDSLEYLVSQVDKDPLYVD